MSTIDHARKRVATVLEEIERLRLSEFPYTQPRDALDLLKAKLMREQAILDKVSPQASPEVINGASNTSLHQLYVYVPILGFILRSTNVRNAFETYDPLLRLAQSILGPETKLILSSEWEFSPFVAWFADDLPGFVLIGLPAPESSNPLLIPLAGHELGHSVWTRQELSKEFETRVEKDVLNELFTDERWKEYKSIYHYDQKDLLGDDILARRSWILAYEWALLQIEEIFCDFFGLRLFGESYLHAFAYLISPGAGGHRTFRYPKNKSRVAHLIEAANAKGLSPPSDFESGFMAEMEPDEPTTKLLSGVADTVSAALVHELIGLAWKSADERGVPTRHPEHVSQICQEFRTWVVPTRKAYPLTDLLNAGWTSYLDPNLWAQRVPQINPEDKSRILRDLVLKSMEVTEINERLRASQ